MNSLLPIQRLFDGRPSLKVKEKQNGQLPPNFGRRLIAINEHVLLRFVKKAFIVESCVEYQFAADSATLLMVVVWNSYDEAFRRYCR